MQTRVISGELNRRKGRLGGLIARGASPEAIAAAKTELKTAVLAEKIAAAMADPPPLTQEQRDRLALQLTGAGDATTP